VPDTPQGAAVNLTVAPGSSLDVFTRRGGPIDVRARRFGTNFPADPVVSLLAGARTTVTTRTDAEAQIPWHLRLSAPQRFSVCAR
jgi:hypothetical protein